RLAREYIGATNARRSSRDNQPCFSPRRIICPHWLSPAEQVQVTRSPTPLPRAAGWLLNCLGGSGRHLQPAALEPGKLTRRGRPDPCVVGTGSMNEAAKQTLAEMTPRQVLHPVLREICFGSSFRRSIL